VQFKKLIVDECGDAWGNYTIRVDDGSKTGDIELPPIATCYALAHAKRLVLAYNEKYNKE